MDSHLLSELQSFEVDRVVDVWDVVVVAVIVEIVVVGVLVVRVVVVGVVGYVVVVWNRLSRSR